MGVALEVLPTLLLLGATYWLISRQMRQMTGGMGGLGGRPGLGGRGGRGGQGGAGGFFNMVRGVCVLKHVRDVRERVTAVIVGVAHVRVCVTVCVYV